MQNLAALVRTSAFAFAGVLLTPAVAAAADGEQTSLNLGEAAKANTEPVGASGGSIVRTIVGLAIVIAVIYGLYWILKQVKNSREESASGVGLHTLATLPLGQNRSMQLIRAGTEVVLVGVGEAGVTPIRTYGENEARALGLLVDDDGDDDPSGLSTVMPTGLAGVSKPTFRQALSRALDGIRRKTVIK
jgi:flagellar protein FliO/FliZ